MLAHGTGALNIDGCRIEATDAVPLFTKDNQRPGNTFAVGSNRTGETSPLGRWPANLIHDGSDEVLAGFPSVHGAGHARDKQAQDSPNRPGWGNIGTGKASFRIGDTGTAARFFYSAKASKADRDEGCEGIIERPKRGPMTDSNWSGNERFDGQPLPQSRNHHPTVKPTALMRYLCKLVTPPAGTVLDPFMGSGSTGKAARMDGFGFIGIEQDADYIAIARARIAHAVQSPAQQPLHI